MAVVNRTGGQLNMTIFGKNLNTKAVDIYQLLITTGDPITFPMDNLSSGNYDYQGVRDRSGKIIGEVQLDEQDPNGEISFTVYEDFDYLGSSYLYGSSKNRMLNMFQGEAFVNGDDIIVPIGTNGTDKTTADLAKLHEMNKPYKALLHNEAGFIKVTGSTDDKTGETLYKKNPYETSFNRTHKTFCMEFRTTSGQGQVNRMLPIVAKSSLELNEGDTNQFSFSGKRGCDVFERDDFWTEVTPDTDTSKKVYGQDAYGSGVYVGKGKIKEIYVNYIVKDGATKPTEGKEGEYIASIDSNGTVTIEKYQGSSYQSEGTLTGKLSWGTRIKSNKLREKNTVDTSVNCFIAIGQDGKAVDFSTDGSKRYYTTVFDYDKTSGKFVPYVTSL